MQRIAIVGGGAAAAAVVGEFLRRRATDDTELTWLAGRTAAAGRGVAYATTCDRHVLNVRAANMGLFADDVSAFARFVQARDPTARASGFFARSLFGDYVEETIGQLRMLQAGGWPIKLLPTEAVRLHPLAERGYRIGTDDGSDLVVDGVVLALGAPPALPLPYVQGSSIASGRYLLDPWSEHRLPEENPTSIAVIGAGLTGTDVILSLAERWPAARFISISRHGYVPGRHSDEPPPPYAFQAQLLEALRSQVTVRQRMRALREAIADAPDWRAVIDGLRSSNVELWQTFNSEERARFLRHVRWAWELARHRMAPAAAEAIDQLRQHGRLEVVAGRIRRVEGNGPIAITYRHRESGELQTRFTDLAVQTTGFQPLTESTPHRLLRQMLNSGLARVDELGLGLDTAANGSLLRIDGLALHGVRAVGTLLRGALWECTALPEIRSAAAKIVKDLPRELRRANGGLPTLDVSSLDPHQVMRTSRGT